MINDHLFFNKVAVLVKPFFILGGECLLSIKASSKIIFSFPDFLLKLGKWSFEHFISEQKTKMCCFCLQQA